MGRGARARPVCLLSLWTLLLACFHIAEVRVRASSAMADTLDAVEMSAVTGGDATLPCDTRSPKLLDVLLLVAWYKDDLPIYSYDSRLHGVAAYWAEQSLKGRAQWHAGAPASLRLRDVTRADAGLYRCRVDFKVSPTQNHKVLLDVIELPEKPKIFDEMNKEIVMFAGPYVEDSSMRLTCVVSGGKPMPRLRWWRNEQVVSTLPPVNDGSSISILELRIPHLTRDYYDAVYSCTADNTGLAPPQKIQVQIQMYLRPLFVEILTKEQPLSVDQKAELSCRAVGSRPPALITWWLDSAQIPTAAKETDNLNETLSVLRWTPQLHQNGKKLTCRASHEKLVKEMIETSITLNLHYAPVSKVQFGSSVNPRDIEEGDDVYLECIVQANPPAYKVVWEHNGQVLMHNQQAGIIIGSSHMALQRAKRDMAGKYTCTASNVEGDGTSPPLTLSIVYKPKCKSQGVMIVGAAVNELTRITCEVDAFPKPNENEWRWTVNNSAGFIEISTDMYTMIEGRSILSFTPRSYAEYGSVNCRASNAAGEQTEPCRYSVLPAIKPDPLTSCSTHNLTDNSLELKCVAGYNGGLHTTYFVEAWESGSLILNLSNPSPKWRLRGLGPGKALKLVFYAHNARGHSESFVMKVNTLNRLRINAESGYPIDETVNWLLGLVAVTAGALLLAFIAVLVVKKMHRPTIQYAAPVQMVKTYKSSTHSENRSPLPPDDKNPDVVQLALELSTRGPNLPPDPPPYRAVGAPISASSRSVHSLHREIKSGAVTPLSNYSDTQSVGMIGEEWRNTKSGTLRRGREVVTTRTPLLGYSQESCV